MPQPRLRYTEEEHNRALGIVNWYLHQHLIAGTTPFSRGFALALVDELIAGFDLEEVM